MEAHIIAEDILTHLDNTFVDALFDRTGIVFEDYYSSDDMVTRL